MNLLIFLSFCTFGLSSGDINGRSFFGSGGQVLVFELLYVLSPCCSADVGGNIYLLSWSPRYRSRKVRKSPGERWFCSESEALQQDESLVQQANVLRY